MEREKFEQAKKIEEDIARYQGYIRLCQGTDTLYYRPKCETAQVPYTYSMFLQSDADEIKQALIQIFTEKIEALRKQFEAL